MAGASDYGAVQRPDGGYAAAQNPASPYGAAAQQQAASPAPSAPTPPKPADPQQVADKLAAIFAGFYKRRYPGIHPNVGTAVPVILVSRADFDAAITRQAEEVTDKFLEAKKRFNPQWVWDKLVAVYKAANERFPYKSIDKDTKLLRADEVILMARLKDAILRSAREDADATEGFYQPSPDGKTMGKLFARLEYAQDPARNFKLAGTMAHEFAHAYTHQFWRDFVDAVGANNLPRSEYLHEGMAVYFEERATDDWMKTQPPGAPRPQLGYTFDSLFADTGKEFIAAVGTRAAYEAHFGGHIYFKDIDKPQDGILVGRSKTFHKWPW